MLHLKQKNILQQLYELRSLINLTILQSAAESSPSNDIGRLYIEFQSKIQENRLLRGHNDQLREQGNRSREENDLLQEKISFLERNIDIYQAELKERKAFCEKIITQKSRLQKQVLLLKKVRIENKSQQLQKLRDGLMERVNNLVKIQEHRQNQFRQVL